MDKETIVIIVCCILLGGLFGFVIGGYVSTRNQVPYEQTYDYLFGLVESYPNNFVRTIYHNKSYITIPLADDTCGVNDYLHINQDCQKDSPFTRKVTK